MLYYSIAYSLIRMVLFFGVLLLKSIYTRLNLNNIIRTITWNKKFFHISQLYAKLNLLKLKNIYKFELAKFMHKIYNDKLIGVLQKLFCKTEKIHSHMTRKLTTSNYFLPRVNKSVGQNIIAYQGVKLWNGFSEEIKSKNFRNFKKLYKENLINEY